MKTIHPLMRSWKKQKQLEGDVEYRMCNYCGGIIDHSVPDAVVCECKKEIKMNKLKTL